MNAVHQDPRSRNLPYAGTELPEDAPAGGGGGFGGPQAPVAEPTVYRVTLTVDGEEFTQLVTVLEDVWMGEG